MDIKEKLIESLEQQIKLREQIQGLETRIIELEKYSHVQGTIPDMNPNRGWQSPTWRPAIVC